jgi:CBS domain-containing protein
MLRIQKTIEHFMASDPLPRVKPDDSVAAATSVMKDMRSDCVLVLDGDKLVGIFTERDFLNRVAARGRSPGDTPVKEVMTASPAMLRARDCITYAINRMAVGGYRNVPILKDGQVRAVLSVRKVMAHLVELFSEVTGPESAAGEPIVNEWTDIGGG